MTSRDRCARRAAAAGLTGALSLVAVLAGCGQDAPGGASGLTGTAAVVQDVEGLGEQPLEAGWVVAVPAAAAAGLWTSTGGAVPSDGELPYVSTPLTRTDVSDAGGAVGAIDDGRFALAAPAGEHLLCLVQDDGAGEYARGCGYADLPSAGRLEVSTGEAGFRVAVVSD